MLKQQTFDFDAKPAATEPEQVAEKTSLPPPPEFIRPDRQETFEATSHYDWPEAKHDRNSITVDRIYASKELGTAHRFTIKRDDRVAAFFSKDRIKDGTVVGISHAKKEVSVQFDGGNGGIWFSLGCIYPAPEPQPAEPEGVPLSEIIAELNEKHGGDAELHPVVTAKVVLSYLEENKGHTFTHAALREQFGATELDREDPLANPVHRALKELRDQGKINVREFRFGNAEFKVLDLPRWSEELTQDHCPHTIAGVELRRLLRTHDQTIADFAKRLQFTQKHVRDVLERGLADQHSVRDWLEALLPKKEQPEAKADVPAEANEPTQKLPTYLLSDHKQYAAKLSDGSITIDELHEGFKRLLDSKEAFVADLVQRFKAPQLKNLAMTLGDWNAKTQRKEENATSIHRKLLCDFHLSDSFTYQMGQDPDQVLKELVFAQTENDLATYIEAKEEAKEASEKALSNPETLREFRQFIRDKGEAELSDSQLAAFDSLNSDITREQRAKNKASETVTRFEAEEIGDLELSIKEGYHDRQKIPLFIVQMGARVERSTFNELKIKAKMLGGWYSSFKKSDAGFQFKEMETAERFVSLTQGDADRRDILEQRKERRELSSSERLHELAAEMITQAEETVEGSKNALQNTARRADMQAGVRGRAYATQALARSIHGIAEALSTGEAKYLDGIRHRTQVATLDTVLNLARWERIRHLKQSERESQFDFRERRDAEEDKRASEADIRFAKYPTPWLYKRHLEEAITHCQKAKGAKMAADRMSKRLRGEPDEYVTFKEDFDIERLTDFLGRAKATGFDTDYLDRGLENFKRLNRANIADIHELRAALREYLPHKAETRGDDPIAIAERELIGKQLPGFFPTPRPTIERMIEDAWIDDGESILEPNAGKGDILDLVKKRFPENPVTAIEHNRTLADVLAAKGHDVEFGDFLEHSGEYDVVLMNPPFEKGADIDHVRHAYSLLRPGGRVVAIMGEGAFFRTDKQATAFRTWLDELGGTSEQLPDDAFNTSEAFRQTGVRTRLVVIESE